MELTWLEPDRSDRRDLDGALAVLEAARAADHPDARSSIMASFVGRLRNGWDGEPPQTAVTRDGSRVVGVLEVDLPKRDNTHLGEVTVTVDPVIRRRGLGRLLFEAGVERLRSDGRSLVLAECFEGTPGVAFLEAMGLERASVDVKRRQDLTALDWQRLDQLYGDAEGRARDYELLRFAGQTPDDMLADMARLSEAINDAPTDDLEIEDEVFSPERVRAMEIAQIARGQRFYRLVARHRESGELAGHTVVLVDVERPWLGSQLDTSVARDHRGHRLGLLLKIGMLRWLREAEPQLRDVVTWNAASNTHMVRVNEELGYTVAARGIGWQRRL